MEILDNISRCLNYRRVRRSVLGSGELFVGKHSVIEVGESAQLHISGELHTNYFNYSNARSECFLKLYPRSEMCVNGRFRMFTLSTVKVLSGAKLTLGAGYINNFSVIACARRIVMGDRCFIGHNVHIFDSDFHDILDENDRVQNPAEPVVIGDNVLIAAGATVLKGVTIGDGAIVGAGAVVTRDVPPNSVVAGNPARVVKTIDRWM